MSFRYQPMRATSLPPWARVLWAWSSRHGVVPLVALLALTAGMVVGGGVGCELITAPDPSKIDSGGEEVSTTRLLAVGSHGSGRGRIWSTQTGIDCFVDGSATSGTCSARYSSSASIVLTVAPDPGVDNTLSGFRLDGVEQPLTSSVTIAMSQDHTASFAFGPSLTEHRLSIQSHGPGRGRIWSTAAGVDCFVNGSSYSGTCVASFPLGASVALNVASDPGVENTWNGFLLDGVEQPLTTPATIAMTKDTTASFAFGPPPPPVQLKVEGSTLASSPGTVTSAPPGIDCHVDGSTVGVGTCAFDFPQGRSVTLTALPDAGSANPSWEVWSPGAPCAPGPTCVIVMDGNRTVAAGFKPAPTVQLTIDGGVTGSPGLPGGRIVSAVLGLDCTPYGYRVEGTCTANLASGTVVTLTALPATGYAFTSLTFDAGQPTCTSSPCQVTVTAATTATASFTALPP